MKETKKRKWYSLVDKIYDINNLREAFKAVRRNRGSAGVDKVTIKEYESNLEGNLRILQGKVRNKEYRCKPVRRCYIEKVNGGQRPLGIPTVEDRVLQQAVRQIIEPIFEKKFRPCSYGFRPGRSAHMAVEAVREHVRSGKRYVIDADLKSYFDTIDHEKLIKEIREEIVDGSLLRLVEEFLKSGVMDNGIYHETQVGAPQGGVVSPLFGNIYLHPLDVLMEERGHSMVRYADDFVIFHKSRKGAERVLKSVTRFLEKEYNLTIHPDKTRIVDTDVESFTFLGFVFYPGNGITISKDKKKTFKNKVKELTKRNQTVNLEVLIKTRVNPYIRGWTNYYGIASIRSFLKKVMSWIRRRLRSVQMRSWRHMKGLKRAMRRNGWKGKIEHIRMNKWRSSKTKQAHYAMDNKWFGELGLCDLVKIHDDYHLQRG